MHTKYCPHCASDKIHKMEEMEQHFDINIGVFLVPAKPYYECEDCNETWEHHEESK